MAQRHRRVRPGIGGCVGTLRGGVLEARRAMSRAGAFQRRPARSASLSHPSATLPRGACATSLGPQRAACRSNRLLCNSPGCLTSCHECMLCLRMARRKERGRGGQVGSWCGSSRGHRDRDDRRQDGGAAEQHPIVPPLETGGGTAMREGYLQWSVDSPSGISSAALDTMNSCQWSSIPRPSCESRDTYTHCICGTALCVVYRAQDSSNLLETI